MKTTGKDIKSIVFLTDSLYGKDNFLRMFCQKASWLAENSEFRVYIVVTEMSKIPVRYELSPKVKVVNLDVNYDLLKEKNLLIRPFLYWKKRKTHWKKLKEFLCKKKAMATVSMMGREMDFLSRIEDGSQRIYELHHNKHLHLKHTDGFLRTGIRKCQVWYYSFWLSSVIGPRDLLVADTKGLMQKWKSVYRNVVAIPNPLEKYHDIPEKIEDFKVIAIGDYSYENGFDHLINVWERISHKFPDWRLHLYGDGDQRRCHEQIRAKHLGKVVLCYERPENLPELYPQYSIFIQAYGYDKFGRHLMEAMAYGVPCIAYNVPYGPDELIRDERNGFLVRPDQMNDFTSKVGILIRDGKLREEMGRHAHEDIGQYELHHVMKGWLELYRSISFKDGRYSMFHGQQDTDDDD